MILEWSDHFRRSTRLRRRTYALGMVRQHRDSSFSPLHKAKVASFIPSSEGLERLGLRDSGRFFLVDTRVVLVRGAWRPSPTSAGGGDAL